MYMRCIDFGNYIILEDVVMIFKDVWRFLEIF